MTTLQTYDIQLFAEHFQFYLQDNETEESLSIYWDADSRRSLCLFQSEIVGVATVRCAEVPVCLNILSKEPKEENLDDFDHVVQGQIAIPSGKLLLTGPVSDSEESLTVSVEPGIYGLRVYYGNLDEVDAEGFEGDDFYQISLWKTDAPPECAVLKLWLPMESERPPI